MRAQDIIETALERTGLWSSYEQTGGPEFGMAFQLMKDLLSTWKLDGLMIDKTVRVPVALVANTPGYAIGTAGDWVVARPDFIDGINFVDANGNEKPLIRLSDAEYQAISDKDRAGEPTHFHYQKLSAALGVIRPWPLYASSGTLALYLPTPLTDPTELDTTMTLATGYRAALTSNLELQLRDIKGLPISAILETRARLTKLAIKDSNRQPPARISTEPYCTNSGGGLSVQDFMTRNF